MKRAMQIALVALLLWSGMGRPASAGGGAGWGGPGSVAPKWARSMYISVSDDSGKPVHYVVFFRGDWFDYSADGCSTSKLRMFLPDRDRSFFVEVRLGRTSNCPYLSVPTSGEIKLTYLGPGGRRSKERLTYSGPGGASIP